MASDQDLIIGSKSSYQQPYDPAGSVSAFHNLPRFGHPSDVSTIFSLKEEDVEDYSKGLIFLGAFLITFFSLWLLVVATFKCLGYKNVGFLSGHGFAKHSTKSKIIRSIFLFSSLMIILFSIFLATLGMNEFQNNTLSTFDETNTQVQAILDQFSDLIDSHTAVEEEAISLRIALDQFLSQDVCPRRPGTVSEQNIREFSSDARRKLLALEDFVAANLEDVKTVVDKTRGVSREVGIHLQEAEEATNGKVYAIVVPMIFLSLTFISALVAAWKKKQVRWLKITVSWVILPLFIIGVLISLFACVGVATSAEANADFCSGSQVETPEATIMAIMDEFGVRKDLLGYQIAIFYMFQCSGTDNPFSFLSSYNIDLQNARQAIQNYESEIQQQTVEELSRICGVNYQPVYDDLVSFATKTDALIGLAQEGIKVISCANIVPLYTSLVHEATCNDSMKAQVWAFTSLLLITFFGMVMVTLRASYQPIGFNEKDTGKTKFHQGNEQPSFGNIATPVSHEYVVVTTERAYQGQKLGIGIGMTQDTGAYHVSKITPDSPFWSTKLEEGMEIQQINGLDLKGQPMNVVMILLQQATSITIVADSAGAGIRSPTSLNATPHTVDAPLPSLLSIRSSNFNDLHQSISEARTSFGERSTPEYHLAALPPTRHMATVAKEEKDQKLGITLARDPQGHFTVSVLNPSSPFLIMGLEVGMRVISINDVEITGQRMADVLELMKESIGDVTVIAEEMPEGVPLPPPPSTGAIHSAAEATMTPMAYAMHNEPECTTSGEQEDTGLGVGQKNDESFLPVANARRLDAVHSADNDGNIRISYHHPQGTTIRAVCTRISRDAKLGVAFKRDHNGVYTVSDISIDSPFLGTGLAVGMRVMSINRIEITGQDMGTVTTIMRNSTGEIIIEASEQVNPEWF